MRPADYTQVSKTQPPLQHSPGSLQGCLEGRQQRVPRWHVSLGGQQVPGAQHTRPVPHGVSGGCPGCVHLPVPSQTSCVQIIPSSVHGAPAGLNRSAGQSSETPSHTSATSHSPAAARQTAPAALGPIPHRPAIQVAWKHGWGAVGTGQLATVRHSSGATQAPLWQVPLLHPVPLPFAWHFPFLQTLPCLVFRHFPFLQIAHSPQAGLHLPPALASSAWESPSTPSNAPKAVTRACRREPETVSERVRVSKRLASMVNPSGGDGVGTICL